MFFIVKESIKVTSLKNTSKLAASFQQPNCILALGDLGMDISYIQGNLLHESTPDLDNYLTSMTGSTGAETSVSQPLIFLTLSSQS